MKHASSRANLSDASYEAQIHAMLDELIELALRIAREAAGRAGVGPLAASSPTLSLDDAVAGFERASRAMRRAIWLAHNLDAPQRGLLGKQPSVRRRILRDIEDAIARLPVEAAMSQQEEVEELLDELEEELGEDLDLPDMQEDIGLRPSAEIIAEVCRDLGLAALLAPGWRRHAPPDLAALCARGAQAGGQA